MDLNEMHWMFDIFQTIDAGLVVIDRDYQIQIWNDFMSNHSGTYSNNVIGKNLFSLFPEIPQEWFIHKIDTIFVLKNSSFTTWEQRPYLFQFKNYQPITGTEQYMYQNVTMFPLSSPSGETNHICMIIYDVTDIATHKNELLLVNSQLEQLSRTDQLTYLNNRGYWEECLIAEFNRYQRSGADATLIILDIDHFKKINDGFGHQGGDEVIRRLAHTLKQSIREVDIAGRYGGEEFAVILVNTTTSGALTFAQRLREHVEDISIHINNKLIRFTISLGIAQLGPEAKDYKQWIENADQALYESKQTGRNRVSVFKSSD